MKRILLIAVALVATMSAMAQNIAVVNPSNVTKIYQTLDEAITNADPGSTIYLPGGGFQIKDETKINKKLTIMGVSHKGDTDNIDGATVIAGSLHFVEGASGSAVLGAYISGDVYIGEDETTVNNVIIKKCNLNSIQVKNGTCTGIIVNQNYIRTHSYFNGGAGSITNNILFSIMGVNGGSILNNIVTGYRRVGDYNEYAVDANNSTISYNIVFFKSWKSGWTHEIAGANIRGGNNLGTNNMVFGSESSNWGDNPINLSDVDLNNLFKFYNGGKITPATDFHFSDEYMEYENQVGIYAGTSFDPDALAPIPRIVSKKVAEQSDGSGKLKIEVTVKAN